MRRAKQRVEMRKIAQPAVQRDVYDRTLRHPQLPRRELHADLVQVVRRRYSQHRLQRARHMLGASPRGFHQRRHPPGKYLRALCRHHRMPQPVRHGREHRLLLQPAILVQSQQKALDRDSRPRRIAQHHHPPPERRQHRPRYTDAEGEFLRRIKKSAEFMPMTVQKIRSDQRGISEVD